MLRRDYVLDVIHSKKNSIKVKKRRKTLRQAENQLIWIFGSDTRL